MKSPWKKPNLKVNPAFLDDIPVAFCRLSIECSENEIQLHQANNLSYKQKVFCTSVGVDWGKPKAGRWASESQSARKIKDNS